MSAHASPTNASGAKLIISVFSAFFARTMPA